MKKYIKRALSLILVLSFMYTGQIYAATGDTSKSSSAIFDWEVDYSHLSRDYNSITYGKGFFVAVGEKGAISVSKDLKNWEGISVSYIPNYEGNDGFCTVLFNGEVFVAAGGRNIFYSKDGYHWNAVAIGDLTYYEYVSYGATNGKTFVLTGPGVLAYSKDGVHWTKHPDAGMGFSAAGDVGTSFSKVIYDGKKYVTLCTRKNEEPEGNYAYTSVDGMHWDITEYKSDDLKVWEETEIVLEDILYNINNTSYRLGDGIYSLENGKESCLYKADTNQTLNGMCSGNGKIAVVGTNGLILFSNVSDKNKKWSLANVQPFKDIYSAASNKTCIVAVGEDGQIIKSSDGVKWQIVNTDIPCTLHSVIYDGTYFIAAGDEGTLARSKDGSTWTLLESNTEIDLYSLKKLNNTYIAVGKSATILTSKDATNWKLVLGVEKDNRTFNEFFSGVTYKDGTYYTISNMNSFVYTSKDAVTWKQTSRLKGLSYSDLIYYKGRFVLIGREMSISKDMKTETINKEGFYTASGAEYLKINAFSDFLLTGAPDGNIYLSSDGILWRNVGGLKNQDCVNSIVEFKGNYYGFSYDGIIIKGVKKGVIPSDSDVTVSAYYNYSQPTGSQIERFETLKNQPIYRNNT
ncbi:MAG TPA: hypothetical protein VHT34_10955, partial [Clostridia bacterium]|nr:hypothetical protein [Clostridia bacterium]